MLAGSKLTNRLSRPTSPRKSISTSAVSWPVSRCRFCPLARQWSHSSRVTATTSRCSGSAGIVRHEADVQPHRLDAQQPGEIGNLLHLRQPRGSRGRRHQADGAGDRGDVGVALPLETAEDHGDANAQVVEPGEKLARLAASCASPSTGRAVESSERPARGRLQAARPSRRRCWQTRPGAIFPYVVRCSLRGRFFAKPQAVCISTRTASRPASRLPACRRCRCRTTPS